MHISLAAEKVAELGGVPITNSMIMGWAASILLVVLAYVATKNLSFVPNKVQNLFEAVLEFLFETANNVIKNRKQTKRFFPLLATIFLFVITNSWLGLIPGIGTIGFTEHHHGEEVFVPLLRPGNADLNTTLAIAIVAVLGVQFFGIVVLGLIKYGKKFINFSGPIQFGIGILELFSEISKTISFAFRLFGNIFAGEVLLTVVAVIVPYLAPLPFFGLELFVGFIQALVFTMLTLVFIKMAITDHDHAEGHASHNS